MNTLLRFGISQIPSILIALAIFSFLPRAKEASAAQPPTHVEYSIYTSKEGVDETTKELNERGAQGWHVKTTTFIPSTYASSYVFILDREK